MQKCVVSDRTLQLNLSEDEKERARKLWKAAQVGFSQADFTVSSLCRLTKKAGGRPSVRAVVAGRARRRESGCVFVLLETVLWPFFSDRPRPFVCPFSFHYQRADLLSFLLSESPCVHGGKPRV